MRTTIILLLVVAAPLTAAAQVVFPADTAYIPLRCGTAPMTDPFADVVGALAERDVVGNVAQPAGLRAADGIYLYLRIRLEQDPVPGGTPRAFAWGMEFDLDSDVNDYELLVLADGAATAGGSVQLFVNTATTLTNDPNDPADQPPVQTYAFATNARSAIAAGTSFGGNPDFFIDIAVPWSALVPLGLDRDTATRVWVGSSSAANSLNGDLACHDGATGAATLSGAASNPTTGDPLLDPNPPGGSGRLEGGAGCTTAGGRTPLWLVLVALAHVRRKRRYARYGR